MTATQALRCERRRQQELQEQRALQALKEAIAGAMAILLLVALFAIAGTYDYQSEQAEIARWEQAGVTIHRW